MTDVPAGRCDKYTGNLVAFKLVVSKPAIKKTIFPHAFSEIWECPQTACAMNSRTSFEGRNSWIPKEAIIF